MGSEMCIRDRLYIYCILGLLSLDIVRLKPIYGVFAILLSLFNLYLSLIKIENNRGSINENRNKRNYW